MKVKAVAIAIAKEKARHDRRMAQLNVKCEHAYTHVHSLNEHGNRRVTSVCLGCGCISSILDMPKGT